MKFKSTLLILFLIVLATFTFAQEHSLDNAISHFNKGEHNTANKKLKQLISKNPNSPMINYYLGAAQTEMGIYSKNTLAYLEKAYKAGIHKKINYYLAVQNHAAENWEKAAKHYRMYTLNVSEEEKNEYDLKSKIAQCTDKINFVVNRYTKVEIEKADTVKEKERPIKAPPVLSTKTVKEMPDSNLVVISIIEKNPQPKVFKDFPIEFTIRDDVKYTNTAYFRTEEGKRTFLQALKKEKQLNDTQKSSEKMRQDYALSDFPIAKDSLAKKISALEKQAYQLKSEYTQLYYDAYVKEQKYWNKLSPTETKKELQNIEASLHTKSDTKEEIEIKEVQLKDEKVLEQTSTQPKIEKTEILPTQSANNKKQLVYKVQIGAFKQPSKSFEKLHKKLSMIRKIDKIVNEEGVTVYSTGHLSNLEDATKLQSQVKKEGVEDAFITVDYNGKRISLNEAHKIEHGL